MKKPFVCFFAFFVSGILLQKYSQVILSYWIILGLFGIFTALVLWEHSTIRWVGVGLLIFLLGFGVQQNADQRPVRLEAGAYGETRMQLLSEPKEKNWYWEIEVLIISAKRSEQTYLIEERALLTVPKGNLPNESLTEGELVLASTLKVNATLAERPLTGYEAYLRSKGVLHLVNAGRLELMSAPESHTSFRRLGGQLKGSVEGFLDRSLPLEEGALLKSILFGNQGYLSEEMTQRFAKSGTAHIVAVSGLHIGMIAVILQKVLSLLKVGKNNQNRFIPGFILLYGYVVGFPVSLIRAGAMYLLYVLAYFLHRRYDAVNGLMLVAFVTVLFNPYVLVTVSFQLSFGATLSILLFYPLIEKRMGKVPAFLRGLLAVNLAAQLGTIPIILYHFEQLSLISILSNLLIVPLIGAVLGLGLMAVAASFISSTLGLLINQVTRWLLTYILAVVRLTGAAPFSSIEIVGTRIFYLWCYYGILLLVYFYVKSKPVMDGKEGQINYELSEINVGDRERAH